MIEESIITMTTNEFAKVIYGTVQEQVYPLLIVITVLGVAVLLYGYLAVMISKEKKLLERFLRSKKLTEEFLNFRDAEKIRRLE